MNTGLELFFLIFLLIIIISMIVDNYTDDFWGKMK
jgi:hypothetical protein